MEIICLEDKAFYALIEKIIEYVKENFKTKEDKWISPAEAMRKLRIKSKATLQKMRDEGLLRFSHPERRIILYDSESIDDYLNGYANKRI
jgi:hypothetical protein